MTCAAGWKERDDAGPYHVPLAFWGCAPPGVGFCVPVTRGGEIGECFLCFLYFTFYVFILFYFLGRLLITGFLGRVSVS